ncbi:MAG: (d)CMP kinase [Anaerolineales bacterium]
MMAKPLTIAIDGPVASGKSTLAKTLAEQLGYLYFDTGAMYRAVTLVALRRGVAPDDEKALEKLAREIEIDIKPASQDDGRLYDVLIDGEDCSWAIREPKVVANVSQVSAFAGVRRVLTEQQRRIGQRGGVVMAGRDIGTVVLPDAELKIYLDATEEERAHRRHLELQARGEQETYEHVFELLRQRDQIDAGRAVAPLRPAADAVILRSDGLERQDVVDEVLRLIADRQGKLDASDSR